MFTIPYNPSQYLITEEGGNKFNTKDQASTA